MTLRLTKANIHHNIRWRELCISQGKTGEVDRKESMVRKLTAIITKEENWYVAHCMELD